MSVYRHRSVYFPPCDFISCDVPLLFLCLYILFNTLVIIVCVCVVCVCVRACVRACMRPSVRRACVRACVRTCMRACIDINTNNKQMEQQCIAHEIHSPLCNFNAPFAKKTLILRSLNPFFFSMRYILRTLSVWCGRAVQRFQPPDRITAWSHISNTRQLVCTVPVAVSQRFVFSLIGLQTSDVVSFAGRSSGHSAKPGSLERQTRRCRRVRVSDSR